MASLISLLFVSTILMASFDPIVGFVRFGGNQLAPWSPDGARFNKEVRGNINVFRTIPKVVLLDSRDNEDYSALDKAVMQKQLDCVVEICKKCPELLYHQNKRDQYTALHHASWRGYTSIISALIDAAIKADLENVEVSGGRKVPKMFLRMVSKTGKCGLSFAVENNQIEAVKLLLESDPEFECGPDSHGETPIIMATRKANSGDRTAGRIRDLLIEAKASQQKMRMRETADKQLIYDIYLYEHSIGSEVFGLNQLVPWSVRFNKEVRGDVNFFRTIPKVLLLDARDNEDYSALDRAVREQQLESVVEICKKCPELLYHQNKGDQYTALHHASWRGYTSIITALIDAAIKAELENVEVSGGKKVPKMFLRMVSKFGRCALSFAVENNQFETVKLLLEADPEFEYGETVIRMSTRKANSGDRTAGRIRDLLIQAKASQQKMRTRETADKQLINDIYLYEHSIGPQVYGFNQLVPWSVRFNKEVSGGVNFFRTISKVVLLDARDNEDYSALDRAVREQQLDSVLEICKKCPELLYHQNKQDQYTALHHASWRGYTSIIAALIDTAIKANLENVEVSGGKKVPKMFLRMVSKTGKCALSFAVENNQFETVKLLLEADPEFECGADSHGETPIIMATRKANSGDRTAGRIRDLLIEAKASQQKMRTREKNWTALYKAASKGDIGEVKKIIMSYLSALC